jgi:hypothetical protein
VFSGVDDDSEDAETLAVGCFSFKSLSISSDYWES